MKSPTLSRGQLILWGTATVVAIAMGLYLANPFLPKVVRIHFGNPTEQAGFEQLALAQGYKVTHWQGPRGETYAVLRGISQRNLEALHCRFQAAHPAAGSNNGQGSNATGKCAP
jgi:hypothetical protein